MKISIITPTYNRADLIGRAIKSIINQSYSNFELIIVDDASKDNTHEIVEEFIKEDDRIKYIKLNENSGVNIARNTGLKSISINSDIITFLDSDDEFFPNALELIIKEFELYSDINFFRFRVKFDNGNMANNDRFIGEKFDFEHYVKNLFNIGEWVCAFRVQKIKNKFQFFEDVKAFEVISFLELSQYEMQYFSKEIIRIYHTGHESITNEKMTASKIEDMFNGYLKIYTDFGEKIKRKDKKVYSKLKFTVSYYLIKRKKILQGLSYNFSAWIISPTDLRFFRNLFAIIKN